MKTVGSIIQVTVIKPKEEDTRGNTGHRREAEGLNTRGVKQRQLHTGEYMSEVMSFKSFSLQPELIVYLIL